MTVAGNTFPIVGVGASAGGVEALEGFFRGIPAAAPGFAVIVVTHLNPERESVLHEIVARYTSMKVQVATETEVLKDQVYVLPADAVLGIEKRVLTITRQSGQRTRKPIDIFLAALAADLGDLAAGVILSGSDGDGTLGVKAIKERGGLTMAQVADGFGPAYPDMPESAIATGFVDFAVPVDEMGPRLTEFAQSVSLLDGIASEDAVATGEAAIERALPAIAAILRSQVNHDFSGYKRRTFNRRIHRRMHVTQMAAIEPYVEMLRHNSQEVNALFRDLMINVTNFFRDADAFESLARIVVPMLFEGRGADDTVRIWVPGCSTGEEVFSIAILLREYMAGLAAVPRVQIFATDIDERALGIARAARYPAALLDSVSPERRKRFFIADGGGYVVSKDVRELCIFSPHSVIRDPPFSRIDLVSCRNLLIYFGVDVQNQVIPTFHYALRPDGYLFLGTAESVSQFDELFTAIEKKHRIFRRRSDISPKLRLPLMVSSLRPGRTGELAPRRSPLGGIALREAVDDQVMERHAPPHVVVNRDGDVVYYSSRTGKYLEAPTGAPTRQLLTMARRGLRLDLRTIFREAVESGRTVAREGIAVEGEHDGVQMVSVTIEPMNQHGGSDQLYLVLFADQGPVLNHEQVLARAHFAQDGAALQIEHEWRETRDRLQSAIEEYETALEELKSSNEELVSVNEEMQSTNEELEASKEELQSVNEELHTVNAELSTKVEALDRANADLQNLFESTDVATIFLDRARVIRSFTPAVSRIFNILPTDRGRPITDLSTPLALPRLGEDIAAVVAGGEPLERRAQDGKDGSTYLVRLAAYRDSDRQIEGAVVSFIDVTGLVRAEERQRVLIAELQHRTRNLLAVVNSIARQTLARGGSLAGFASRLEALGRVQGLVSGTMNDEIDLGEIVRLELKAVGATAEDKVTVSGPTVALGFELMQTFGLALHELATNAVKHGALRDGTGRLDVSWAIDRNRPAGPVLILDWRESGVNPMPAGRKRGFGRELIERALAFTLRAKTDFAIGREGISCHIEVPLNPASTSLAQKS